MHYFGGKFKISKDLANVLNPITKGKPFVDLFCGACNVVEKITTASSRTANDNNPYLIALLIRFSKALARRVLSAMTGAADVSVCNSHTRWFSVK